MASKFIRAATALPLALAFYFVSETAPVQAEPSVFQSPVQLHTFKFYLDPALVPDMAFAKAVLPKYVSDMNTVLAKNTNRQLAFDPETGIILTDTKPETGSAPPPLPTEGFEIWAHAIQTTTSLSYGGYASLDISGAGVVDGIRWTRLHDPDHLGAGDVLDYTRQISTLLHELGHIFGAGIGEYYSLTFISDTTNTEPLLGIDLNSAGDPYWIDKPDFMADPLLQGARADSRDEYLAKVQYSKLTAAILNGPYRNGIPSFDKLTVQVVDQNGLPVASANVKIWSVLAGSPFTSQLLYDVQTDEAGQVTVAWGGAGGPHNVLNLLRLIKVYRDGAAFNPGKYVSIFDADIAQLVKGQSSFVVVMRPPNHPPTEVTLSNAGLDENQPAGTLIGEVAAVDPDSGDTVSFSFCGGPDGSFQLDGNRLLSATTFDYELTTRYGICLRADDGQGGRLDRTFTVSINDLPDTTTATFTSTAANDGAVLESGAGTNKGGWLNAGATRVKLGNSADNRRYRSVLAFATGSLPDDAIITKVTLKIRLQGVTGGDPFASLGDLVVDVGKPWIGSSAGLQLADFQAQPGLASAGKFTRTPDEDGWYSAVLKSPALSSISLAGATQFRLRFSVSANTGAEYLTIYSGNAAAENKPMLIVEYELPSGTAVAGG